ncbi:MAG: M15 family metallopeptidase [Bacillota bacterium]
MGLVNIIDVDETIEVALRYATADNFLKKPVYPVHLCLLRYDTAIKLKTANEEFKKNGYHIKIWDGYRPLDVQQIFWDALPDSRFMANPKRGSRHNRGGAVDVTLVDENGKELEMPTGFDDFTERASRLFTGNPRHVQENVDYLTNIMIKSGFTTIDSEWWHFDDRDWEKYEILNIDLLAYDK